MSDDQFVFYRNTKDRCGTEREAEVMEACDDEKEPIDYDDFIQKVAGFTEILTGLAYPEDLDIAEDWSVGFYESKYGGLPALIFSHTECDFLFLKPNDAKMLAETFAKDGDPEWERKTSFGTEGHSPTYSKFVDDTD